jgi:hypothetical protein
MTQQCADQHRTTTAFALAVSALSVHSRVIRVPEGQLLSIFPEFA